MPGEPPPDLTWGWDLGGAHLKACRLERGVVVDVAQWACPLWQGLQHLDAVLAQAHARWPDLKGAPGRRVRQAATMTGEMVDLFRDREDGVLRLAAHLDQALGGALHWFAGRGLGSASGLAAPWQAAARWVGPTAVPTHWEAIASANWRATAEWLALALDRTAAAPAGAVLVDIGSTTSDLIALRGGRPVGGGQTDAQRLASGELVYQGVVRTPLCALTQRVVFQGRATGVMNEWFATTADVHRLLGTLDPAHDQQPTADNAGKDLPATRQRLARMIGRDARDGHDNDWLALAAHWRDAQRSALQAALTRVAADAGLTGTPTLVSAGCGDFLVPALAQALGWPVQRFADHVPWASTASAALVGWGQVAAPAVAVALLAGGPHRHQGEDSMSD